MPRKVQYSREMIIDAAIEMVREKGYESINARDLGAWLGCSSRPLFTAFKNMEELINATRAEACNRFLQEVLVETPVWQEEHSAATEQGARSLQTATSSTRDFGFNIVRFARQEPNLYNFIHWGGGIMPDRAHQSKIMSGRYATEFGLTIAESEGLFQQMMLFSLGLCSMITYKVKVFTEEEIASLLKQQFVANLQYLREHAKDRKTDTHVYSAIQN